MELFYEKYSKDDFINICFDEKSEIYILGFDENSPLAIGGIYKTDINGTDAQLWLLTTNETKKIKVEFLKYLKSKIKYFKSKFQVLYNVVYKSNFKILKFLKKFDFKVRQTSNPDFKLFYYNKKGGKIDI